MFVREDLEEIKEHIPSKDCWCKPRLEYVDPMTGAEVWVHQETQ